MARPTVLVLLGCFSRGVEATGPNQSLLGMVERLSDRFRFRVLAEAVPGDIPGRWTSLRGVEQMPLVRRTIGARGLRRAIRQTPHDVVITNSVMDPVFTGALLVLRRLGLIPSRPVLLAPRGELGSGSLGIRGRKKASYLALLRMTGMLDGVTFQATSELERDEIRSAVGADTEVWVTPNIRAVRELPDHLPRAAGEPLRLVYLSRIDRKKNLDFAIKAVTASGVSVILDVFGPVSDNAYWAECQALIEATPDNVTVRYHGSISQKDVPETLARYDMFVLPTRNENFGHAIADALLAGTPALLSDQTPWRGLQGENAGWDLPLEDAKAFAEALRHFAALSEADRLAMRAAARSAAERRLDPAGAAAMLEQCLNTLVVRQRVSEMAA